MAVHECNVLRGIFTNLSFIPQVSDSTLREAETAINNLEDQLIRMSKENKELTGNDPQAHAKQR